MRTVIMGHLALIINFSYFIFAFRAQCNMLNVQVVFKHQGSMFKECA